MTAPETPAEHSAKSEDQPQAGPLSRVRVVMNEPQNLINIAAVIRGMSNMGLSDLVLVQPAEFDAYRITGIAHRTDELVEATRIVSTLDEALEGASYVLGTSARARTAQRNYRRPRQASVDMIARARAGETVAIVFGREDRGLGNEALDRCHEVLVIPTDSDYSSLNLAQAFLVIAYELFVQAGEEEGDLPTGKRSLGPATHQELEEMYGALEAGLQHIQFFKSRKVESVMRTLRTALSRTTLDLHEARLIRAVGYEVRAFVRRSLGLGPAGPVGSDSAAPEEPSLADPDDSPAPST